jgi:DNA-directed RNA polymerase subunit K/omega
VQQDVSARLEARAFPKMRMATRRSFQIRSETDLLIAQCLRDDKPLDDAVTVIAPAPVA